MTDATKGYINNNQELTIEFSKVAATDNLDSFHGVIGTKNKRYTLAINPNRKDRN